MSFPARLLNQGETVLISTRTHPKALIGPALLAVVLVACSILVTRTGVTGMALLGWALAAAAFVGWVLRPVVAWLTTTYTFTTRRFVKRSGLIAKEGRTIPLNRISGVDFEIGIVDRVFGCGTLIVSDASTDGRVLLDDIPRVEEVQLRVAEQLHELSGGSRSDDGT